MKINGKNTLDIVLAGVGGQGTLVAGRLLGAVAQTLSKDVKVSEVHGMSQRGGSVITYARLGDEVFSPTVEEGRADFLWRLRNSKACDGRHCSAKAASRCSTASTSFRSLSAWGGGIPGTHCRNLGKRLRRGIQGGAAGRARTCSRGRQPAFGQRGDARRDGRSHRFAGKGVGTGDRPGAAGTVARGEPQSVSTGIWHPWSILVMMKA